MMDPTPAELSRPQAAELPPDTNAGRHVFVSYASVDRDRVLPIVDALKHAGVRVWLDRSDIPSGVNYGPEIAAAVKESQTVLLVCSAAAFSSRNVRQEVTLAWKYGRPILPLLLEPGEISDELAYWIEGLQWIEVLDRPESMWLPELLQALSSFGADAELMVPKVSSLPVRIKLPTPLTALLGRDAEVRAVVDLIEGHRLVTLVGPGGVGKTRLAIDAARAAAPAFPEGAVFVDLSPVRSSDLVLFEIAQVLEVSAAPGRLPAERLEEAIEDRRLLLVLDNLEQVAGAAPDIAKLLSRCPRLAVLGTSRMLLGVRGEVSFPVTPLALPSASRDATTADLASFPAVELFVARALEVRPGFVFTDENAHAIAEICTRLDGLPLAIELAAARIKLLSPAALCAELTSCLPLLTAGARDLPERQRTLRDTIAWSHDLLTPEEQVLFRRIAVFVDGCTLEAASAVGDHDGHIDTFSCLTSLVDLNLLWQTEARDERRFHMLETIREYGLERLLERAEEDQTRRQHAAWFVALAEAADSDFWEPRSGQWADRLAAEHGNFQAVVAWALEHGEAEMALRLTTSLAKFLDHRGRVGEGRRWLERILAPESGLPPNLRAHALLALGDMARLAGDYEVAFPAAEESLLLARQSGDQNDEAEALTILGCAAEDTGDLEAAVSHLEAALLLFRKIGAPRPIGILLFHLGRVLYKQGQHTRSRVVHTEALDLQRAQGDTWGAAWTLTAMAEIASTESATKRAAELFRDALDLHATQGDHYGIGYCLLGLGKLAATSGQSEVAAHLLAGEQALREARGMALPPNHWDARTQAIALLRGELGEAAFAAYWAAGHSLSADRLVDEARAMAETLATETNRASL